MAEACFKRRLDEDSSLERGVARLGEAAAAAGEGDNVAEAGLACGSELRVRCRISKKQNACE